MTLNRYQIPRKAKPRPIAFVSIPIDANLNDVYTATNKDDKALASAICEYRKEIERQGILVVGRKYNMLMTETNYIFALYEQINKPK
jgi:hypothetical protein